MRVVALTHSMTEGALREAGAEIEDTQSAVSLVGLLMKFVTGGDDE